ncbi:hypothetical protein Ade02nite_16330 [Paractinoplanes deccanensis]|uniref:AB hydrolase-1 domain-containing protein n=1 Tax=Paractinoplanes deccanensis TaxID=113561 RepID=A0ABQ3XZ39_9ACTN|nr:alpha/beta hydrolase [Actinoplanes deccanensis]GID72992.1 hypothetical protein Ade02nite_16330 [Actinoplanes deccanensis]
MTPLVVRREGTGDPIVLLHGSGGGLHSWDPLIEKLADTYELWIPARRGYAPSTLPPTPKSFADEVTDVLEVLDRIGRPAHLVGASYGALLALHTALAAPSHTALAAPPPAAPPHAAPPHAAPPHAAPPLAAPPHAAPPLAAPPHAAPPHATEPHAAEPHAAPPHAAEPHAAPPKAARGRLRSLAVFEPPLFATGAVIRPLLDRYRACFERDDHAGMFAVLNEVTRVPADIVAAFGPPSPDPVAAVGWLHDLEALTAESPSFTGITVPTLILQGADTWEPMPTSMDALAADLPTARRVTWAGQSHFAPFVAPELMADALRSFYEQAGL